MKTFQIFCCWIIVVNSLQAQTEPLSQYAKITTLDGIEYFGLILSDSESSIKLQTNKLGVITISTDLIKTRIDVDPKMVVEGKFWDHNPEPNRYLLAPSAFGLKKGEISYQNIWLLYNKIGIGVTDYFSVTTGIIPLFIIGSEGFNPAWIMPKFSFPVVKNVINFSTGAIIGLLIGSSEPGNAIFFNTVTFGNRNYNLNIGVGWDFMRQNFSDKPSFNFSVMQRMSSKSYLLFESYFIPTLVENERLFSAGYRYRTSRFGLDIGMYLPITLYNGSFILPILGCSLPIVKK
jgi:hypothetical protein